MFTRTTFTSMLTCARGLACASATLAAFASLAGLTAPAAEAQPLPPGQDPFYSYTGTTPLSAIAPGTVLKTREESYHVAGVAVPIEVVQLLYRSTTETGQPTVNVTSVLEPPAGSAASSSGPPNVVAYQSFYDSLDPDDEPSYSITGGVSLTGGIPDAETALIAPELLSGDAVVVADDEGEQADFAAGPEYGKLTLDSLRAALSSPATGLVGATKVAMVGYSGGAIATEWAAELAPKYAPQLNSLIVGASFGGVLVDPDHNLHYINGSALWAGVLPMALIGISRAFGIDLTPYMTAYGQQLFSQMQNDSITQVLGEYPGLTWSQIAKPQYQEPEQIPIFVKVANQLIMGEHGTPTEPLLIAQGADGTIEGSNGFQPGIGPGDGVMIAGDVRTLAREYCSRGVAVQYDEYDALDHIGTAAPWMATTVPWLAARFAGQPAPENCGQIAPGNVVAPIG
jgi:hypothetical protein